MTSHILLLCVSSHRQQLNVTSHKFTCIKGLILTPKKLLKKKKKKQLTESDKNFYNFDGNCFLYFSICQGLEATQKATLPLQNGILALVKLTATLTKDTEKAAANATLVDLRKADEVHRDRLFVLQVWKHFDHETADSMARFKAGEYLDPDLNKALAKREKRLEREKREKDREEERSHNEPKRFKDNGGGHYGSNDSGHQSSERGTYGSRGRCENTRDSKKPSAENTCHTCGGIDHFFKSCPTK